MVPLLSALLLAGSLSEPAQVAPATKLVRPCAASWNGPPADSKKKQPSKRTKAELPPDPGLCIELAYPQLDIQEFLQSRARKEQWKIFEERVTEETWSFSLSLTRAELLKSTKDSLLGGRVDWTKGVALVTVTTFPLPDGFSRTIIRAGFRGYPKSVDQFLTDRQYWELESNHSLEESMIEALTGYIQTAPPQGQGEADPPDN